jgi:hypothetical protein
MFPLGVITGNPNTDTFVLILLAIFGICTLIVIFGDLFI